MSSLTPFKILIIGVLIYIVWSLIHHKKDKSLTFPIFIEYLLTAVLALVLITGVIF